MSDPVQVQRMFARIAPRYDLLNRVLSGRRDVAWRQSAIALLGNPPGECLDLACGTFDLGLEALHQGKATRVHGCDFCQPMLVAGTVKRQGQSVTAAVGDARRLPYADASFDTAMVAYGWRNFPDPQLALAELSRVLRPGGELLILEFFRPEGWWPRTFYGTFGRWVMPVLGGWLAGDAEAYRYLNRSIQGFLSVSEATQALATAGFGCVRWRPFFGGVSHAVCARKGG